MTGISSPVNTTKFMRSSLARKLAGLFVNMYWNFPPALGTIISKIGSRQLNKKMYKSLEELVNLAFSFKFIPFVPMKAYFAPFSIMPAQVREEILELLKILIQYKPKKYIRDRDIERGDTFFILKTR